MTNIDSFSPIRFAVISTTLTKSTTFIAIMNYDSCVHAARTLPSLFFVVTHHL